MRSEFIRFGLILMAGLLPAAPATGQVAGTVPSLPSHPFDPAGAPPPPDYAGSPNWASLPWIRDDGDMTPAEVPDPPQLRAPADVFFIHPSVMAGGERWNGDTRDLDLNGRVGQTPIRNQASAFNACCAIYAPRYRQPPTGAHLAASVDSVAAIELAYADLLRAFREFRRRVGDRPFVLAGHAEGSQLARLLIEREIDGKPIANRLVAAYLIGLRIDRDWFAARRDIRHCTGASDTGCVVSWSIRADGDTGKRPATDAVCNNPLSWTTGRSPAPATAHRGAWMRNGFDLPEPLRAPDAALIGARCGADGTLHITPPGERYEAFRSPDGSYAALDYQLVWRDVRDNAVDRVAAFLASR